MIKRTLILLLLPISMTACISFGDRSSVAMYDTDPFFLQFSSPRTKLDNAIAARIEAIRENPDSPALHNELGMLLADKSAWNRAQREFELAVEADPTFYPAWYNLGLTRLADGNEWSAMRAFRRTIRYKRGHAEAHFQLGLLAEKHGHSDRAVEHYMAAISHNHAILDVARNPKILDAHLIPQALIRLYPHAKERAQFAFHPTPNGYHEKDAAMDEAVSKQAKPAEIVTPAPPVTDPATQTVPPRP